MKIIFAALFALAVIISQPVLAAEKTVILDVENMTCALCPITVSKALKGVEGVSSVKVDMDSMTATVVYDDAVAELTEIADASTFAGYPATPRN